MIRESANSLLSYFGTTQSQRRLAALMPDYVKVDERSLADLLAYAAAYAKKIRYFTEDGRSDNPETGEDLNWELFFEQDVSVFLATLLATDLQKLDEEVQTGFLRAHQLTTDSEHVSNLTSLINSLLDLTEILSNWFDQAKRLGKWNEEYRVEQEIKRAFQGDLGEQFWIFYATTMGFAASPEFKKHASDVPDWEARFSGFDLGIDFKNARLQIPKSRVAGSSNFGSQAISERRSAKGEGESKADPAVGAAPKSYGKKRRQTIINDLLARLLLPEQETQEAFSEQVKRIGGRLQEYYRLLYATLAYLQEIAPELFRKSIEEKDDHDPAMGLLISFLQLFAHAQHELNRFTEKHLNYYYDEVLGRRMKDGLPDRAAVSFQLAENVNEHLLPAGTRLFAGINQDGVASFYETDDDLYINQAKVERLSTVFVSKNPLVKTGSSYRLVTAIYHAPFANSLDGKGAPLASAEQTWPLLGEDQFELGEEEQRMERSQLGFAVATSTLLVGEGEREVTLDLNFTQESFASLTLLLDDLVENANGKSNFSDVFNRIFNRPFQLQLTGSEGWLVVDKYAIIPPELDGINEPRIRITFLLPPSYPAVKPYQEDIHLAGLSTPWPVLKVLLNEYAPLYSYSFLRDLELSEIKVKVKVKGMKNLKIFNDQSLLDASAPFVPFGSMPKRNAYFLFGHTELFNKKLSRLSLNLNWANLPEEADGFKAHYAGYGKEIDNGAFRFGLSAISDYHFRPKQLGDQDEFLLFTTNLALENPLQDNTTIELKPPELKKLGIEPLYELKELEEFTNQTRTGYFKLTLTSPSIAFGHSIYPRVFAQAMARMAQPKPFNLLGDKSNVEEIELPNSPYTPELNSLTVDYVAESVINLRQLERKENNPAADNKVFRWHPFGCEVLYDNDTTKPAFLLPRLDHDGYLLIGIRDLHPPQTISFYFDIEESQQKFLRSSIEVTWSFLQNDSWVPFEADQLISDTTVDLSTSGSISLYCKSSMTKNSKVLDPDLHWIRIAATGNLQVVGRCKSIIPQVMNVRWVNNGDASHLTTPPSSRPLITGLAQNHSAIQQVTQVRPFYGGKLPETREEYYIRGSERLRHKGRGVSLWDIERLVLEKFPLIHQVKCLGRHGNENTSSPGQVIVVVVPEITRETLTPTVGYHVIQEIEAYLATVMGPFASIQVINPAYERVKVNCRIKLTKDSERLKGKSWRELHESLINFICPWLTKGSLDLGGSLTKNEVLAVINESPRVDFVTAFSLVQVYEEGNDFYRILDTAAEKGSLEVIQATKPWSLLVPVDEHQLVFIDEDEYLPPTPTAIDDGMQLETDFIVSDEETSTRTEQHSGSEVTNDTDFELPQSWLGLP